MVDLILASSSLIRREMLENAGLRVDCRPARLDEAAIRESLLAEGAEPRDVADTLAEFKARRVAEKANPGELVLGCDQVLALKGEIFGKAKDQAEAAEHLKQLQGKTHHLMSAAVLYEDNKPVWRHVGVVRMTMHALSDKQINDYLDAAWPDVSYCVGAYQVERLGARLFSRIEGDWFSVLGLPLLDVLSHLRLRGMLGA
ncbi:nucleoside triphosphate pyrophosphatase [Gymnodinialimonas hymeniacidonis]|uniref:Maf family protein n=1 Tax=Gymnodinialimonas hymeniacidonis TaxID=3126508 RepID=UPI0034C6AEC1